MKALAVCAVIACASGARGDAAPACERSVQVSGDAAAAADVRDRLANRGVGDTAQGCEPVRARVDRRGDGLRIEVVDGSGRRSQRDVRDAATAVALIESWIAPEVVPGEDLPGAPVDAGPAVVATKRAGPVAAGVGVVLGPARADDSSTWLLGAAQACGAIGPVCVGGRVEIARDLTTDFHPRQIATASVTAQVTWRLGAFAVVPGVAIGPAWNRVGGGGVHMNLTTDDASLRVGARLGVLRTISGAWAVELEVAGDGAAAGGGPALFRAALGLHRGWW